MSTTKKPLKISTVFVYIFLSLNAIAVLAPVIWTVLASFKPGTNCLAQPLPVLTLLWTTTVPC